DLPRLTVDRADINDPPETPLAHARNHGPAHVEAGGEVRLDDVAPGLLRHAVQHGILCDAGIVDQYVDLSVSLVDAQDALLAGVVIRDVPGRDDDARLVMEALRTVDVPVIVRHHPIARSVQPLGDLRSNAAGSARDHSDTCHVILPEWLSARFVRYEGLYQETRPVACAGNAACATWADRKSTRLNSSHV